MASSIMSDNKAVIFEVPKKDLELKGGGGTVVNENLTQQNDTAAMFEAMESDTSATPTTNSTVGLTQMPVDDLFSIFGDEKTRGSITQPHIITVEKREGGIFSPHVIFWMLMMTPPSVLVLVTGIQSPTLLLTNRTVEGLRCQNMASQTLHSPSSPSMTTYALPSPTVLR